MLGLFEALSKVSDKQCISISYDCRYTCKLFDSLERYRLNFTGFDIEAIGVCLASKDLYPAKYSLFCLHVSEASS